MTVPKTPVSRGADIVHSPDDGGWWVQLWQQALGGDVTQLDTPESPLFPTADKAEAWARRQGSTVFLRVG